MNRSEFLRISAVGTATAMLCPRDLFASSFTANHSLFDIKYDFEGTPKGLRPYLQTPRPDSIWVSWWTDTDRKTLVEFGTDKSKLNRKVTGEVDLAGNNFHYHYVQLKNLRPDTWYFYRAVTENTTSEIFRFRTPKKIGTATGTYRVLVLGDNQVIDPKQQRYERLVERAKKKVESLYQAPFEEAIDLVVMPGDQVDVGTLDHYRNLHFKYCGWISPTVPIMTSVGNHETYKDSKLANYKRVFFYDKLQCAGVKSPMPKIYNAYQLANIAFVHTSSEHGNDQQTRWVRELTAAIDKDKSVDWMISICHRPYHAEQYVGDISHWLRDTAMEILSSTQKHVLNIGAHHHLYARGQTRNWPVYHIISGGSAWDQAWGMSTEIDYDDVQKTIAHWAWQLIEFDLNQRTMDVKCFAEGNVKFDQKKRWGYNSKRIDRFHRKLGLAPPEQPAIATSISKPIQLPFKVASTSFKTSTSEKLNSTQFQIAQDKEFSQLDFDLIRDVENIYGDTGSPDFVPVDTHRNVDILRFELPKDSLPNGKVFARVRHRDTNVTWSDWSKTVSFTVTGSANSGKPIIELAKTELDINEDILIDYKNAPGHKEDWIGIYRTGQTPGKEPSSSWKYISGRHGKVILKKNLPAGEYFAGFFTKGGYEEIASRLKFVVKRNAQ